MSRCSEEEVNKNGEERHIESYNRRHICQHGISHAYKQKIALQSLNKVMIFLNSCHKKNMVLICFVILCMQMKNHIDDNIDFSCSHLKFIKQNPTLRKLHDPHRESSNDVIRQIRPYLVFSVNSQERQDFL